MTSTGEVQPCEASECSFGNVKDEDFLTIYRRASEAFQRPSTGCIPMAMYEEVREYCRVSDSLTSQEKGEMSSDIIRAFEDRGMIPGALGWLWPIYEKRLRLYRKRLKLLLGDHSMPHAQQVDKVTEEDSAVDSRVSFEQ